MLKQSVLIEECLPANHLARFVVEEIAALDLREIYSAYGPKGGMAIAPEILLGLLFYGYATGVFSSREIERSTYESIPFRYIGGNFHPDHDTIAYFRTRFLVQIEGLFVQVLERAVACQVITLEDISIDGTKIHADASKSKAVSHKRLGEIQEQLAQEVEELEAMIQSVEATAQPLDIASEIDRRRQQLAHLAEAQQVLTQRAQERYEQEQGVYTAQLADRAAYTERTGQNPRGKVPLPPFLSFRARTNTTSQILNRGS